MRVNGAAASAKELNGLGFLLGGRRRAVMGLGEGRFDSFAGERRAGIVVFDVRAVSGHGFGGEVCMGAEYFNNNKREKLSTIEQM